jgi:UDP-2-acetamido-3-amino-2,3-dideoxy-glucuronate N-acetyltransferase
MTVPPSIQAAIVDAGRSNRRGQPRLALRPHLRRGSGSGKACSFGQNVFVGNDVTIGNNVKVQNNVSIYDAVHIEDDVFCGPSMVFTNVYNPRVGGHAQG